MELPAKLLEYFLQVIKATSIKTTITTKTWWSLSSWRPYLEPEFV